VLCFNTGKYVVETLNSVLGNGYPNLEVLCIDDASSDGVSGDIVRSYCADRDGVRFMANSKNLGITKNLNLALGLVSGEFLILLGDDLLLPGKIDRDIQRFRNSDPSTAVVFSVYQSMSDDGTLFPHFVPSMQYPLVIPKAPTQDEFIAAGGFVTTPTAMIRKSAVERVGGWDERISWEDKQMWFKLFHEGYSFEFRAEVSTHYRRLSDSVSSRFRSGDLVGQMLCYLPYSGSPVARRELRRVIYMAASARLSGIRDIEECLALYKTSSHYSYALYLLGRFGVLSLLARLYKSSKSMFRIVQCC
jgi:glycosyltransferase involved in cell wall biosynthesis